MFLIWSDLKASWRGATSSWGTLFVVLFLLSDFYKAATLWLPIDLTAILGIIALIIAVYRTSIMGEGIPVNIWIMPLFIILIVFPSVFSMSVTDYASDKLFRIGTVASVAVIATPMLIRKLDDVRLLAWFILLLAIGIGLMMVWQIIQGIDFWRWQAFEISTISLGRGFGYGMVCSTFFALVQRNTISRIYLLIIASCFAIMIVGVGNRQGMLGGVLAIVIGWALLSMGSKRKLFIGLVSILLVSILLIVVMPNVVPQYAYARVFSPIESEIINASSGRSRIFIFTKAVDMFVSNPMGGGLGAFADLGIVSGIVKVKYPHNIFLEIMSESGLLALIYLMAVLLILVIKLKFFAKWKDNGVVLAMIVATAFVAANLSSDIPGNKLLLGMMSIALCIPVKYRKYQMYNARYGNG